MQPLPQVTAPLRALAPVVFFLAASAMHADAPVPSPSPDARVMVESLDDLQTRIKDAKPGDVLILKNGTYTANAALTIGCAGTAEQPITIAAESIGGAEIGGSQGLKLVEPAEHVVIRGFKFTHAAGKTTIADGTRYVRFSQNFFQCTGDGHSLAISGDDVQIDNNDFGPKKDPGTLIAVSGTGGQVARRLWVHHNAFHDFDNDGSNGSEMIRVGLLSSHRLSKGSAIFEHNLFSGCRRVNDMISNRCSGNIYRYNTFVDSASAHLTIRQGDGCSIYGNVFRNTEGIRLYGDRHLVFSNYFEKNYIGVAIGNGTADLSVTSGETPNNAYDRPDECLIAFNTFVDNNTHFQMSRRTGGLGATKTTFANNVVQGGTAAAKIDGPNADAVWQGNLVWQCAPRDLPSSGFTSADPLLSADEAGIRRPQNGSPVLGAATGDFPAIDVDLDGQPRPPQKSVGADEITDAPVVARSLRPGDVGPLAESLVSAAPKP